MSVATRTRADGMSPISIPKHAKLAYACGTHSRTHGRTPFFFHVQYDSKRRYLFARALYGLRDGSRDASGRALAFRGLRALKFAADLRRTFPFFRLFGDRRRCNTGTGSAALKSPDYYIHAERRVASHRAVPCRAMPHENVYLRLYILRQPDGIDKFLAARPTSLLNERANKEPTSWQGVAIQNAWTRI